MRISLLWKSFAVIAVAAVMAGVAGCSDNAVTPDPNAGKTAAVTLLNVNPGFAVPVNFADGTTNIATSVAYGVPTVVQEQIGTRTLSVKGTDGSTFASTGVQVDSSRPTWIIHAGTGTVHDAIGVDAPKVPSDVATALAAGSALVRFIHASQSAGNATLHLGTSIGSKVADNIEYKKSSSFTTVDTATKYLVLTKGTTADTLGVSKIPTQLVAGKLYTVVLYGSSDPSASAGQVLTARIVAEP